MKRLLFFFIIAVILILPVKFFIDFLSNDISQRVYAYTSAGDLSEKISAAAKDFSGDFSFVIKDLNNQRLKFLYNEDDRFAAASLIKVPILAVAFKAIGERRFSLDTILIIERKDITGGSGVIKTMKLPVRMSVRKLLEKMIAESDNTAANKIIKLLGFDYINESFKELGLKNTVLRRKMMDFSKRKKGVENYTTASDTALIMEKIYKKELVNGPFSKLAVIFLKRQKVNDRIPRYLPQEIAVAHKTGLERGVVHDAGIVFTSKGSFIICVLTKDVKDYSEAKKFIAKLSLLTYNLYQ